MNSTTDSKLEKPGFKLKYVLIIGILALSFSISFMIKILPSEYGWELNEFDPFFNYRATEYIIENGFSSYFDWNDDLSWYPYGRDVSSNSQVFLHIFSATIYWIFGMGSNLYDFTILLPVVIGSLSCIIIFGLVRTISGTTPALLSSILFSVSIPILLRGSVGWFKSEPLGLFLGLLSTFLILNAIKSKNLKKSYVYSISSAIITIMGISAWGGNIFFFLPLGGLICFLPFVRKDHYFLLKVISLYSFSIIITSFLFERVSYGLISNYSSLLIILPTIIMTSIILIQKISSDKTKIRNSIFIFLIFTILIGIFIFVNDVYDILPLPSHRYLNAILPTLTTSDPLTDSVSEHSTLNIFQSFQLHSVLMIFAAIGIWLMISRKEKFISKDMTVFTLFLGILSAYIGSSFMRLEVFTSIGIIILASIGISVIFKNINFYKKNSTKNNIFSFSACAFIIVLLLVPLFYPLDANILSVSSSTPPTILNGASHFSIATNDWRDSLEWIKENTPQNSVIGSWWDYGYWIQTISERPTLVDNSTVIDHRIKTIAQVFFETPDDAWKSLTEMETDYFLIFVVAEQLPYTTNDNNLIYSLNGGGDESKKIWFAKIANIEISKYIHTDSLSGTQLFWDNTFLGQIIPFENLGYVNIQTNEITDVYTPGWLPVYSQKIKLNDESQPFKLVYSSPSTSSPVEGKMIGVFVYEINKNYTPISEEWNSPVISYPK